MRSLMEAAASSAFSKISFANQFSLGPTRFSQNSRS
jgi:hypothetical protein